VLFPNTTTYSLWPMKSYGRRAGGLEYYAAITTHLLPHGARPTSPSDQQKPALICAGVKMRLGKKTTPSSLCLPCRLHVLREQSTLVIVGKSVSKPSFGIYILLLAHLGYQDCCFVAHFAYRFAIHKSKNYQGPSPLFRRPSTLAFPCSVLSAAEPAPAKKL